MSYASGGLIQATDYNELAQTNVGGNIAFVWGTGSNQWGYGQTTTQIATVSASGTVTATQWAGLIYTLNKTLAHQGGTQLASGSNIGVTSGALIQYFSNVATAATTIATNRLSYGSSGSTTTGANFTGTISFPDSSSTQSSTISRTVTFASGNAARYFFNAGGRLILVLTASNNNGTSRSGDFVTVLQTNVGGSTLFATSSTPRSGAGGTLNSQNAALGYYSLTTSNQTVVSVNSASATYVYAAGDSVDIRLRSNGTQGSNDDKGSVITIDIITTAQGQVSSNFNDAVNVTLTSRVDIVYPETTYLTDTWGTPTIT
jgi:hypothetical protein